MHKSVGAIIRNKKGEILMIERKKFPLGWACPAGHVDKGESPEEALRREVKEETGLKIEDFKLLVHEFVEWNECSKGVRGHDWYVYEAVDFEGEIKKADAEAKNIKWVDSSKLRELELEEVWKKWFKQLKIIS